MNTVMRLEVAMNKIYKNSLYYQTLYLFLLFAQEPAVCVRRTVCVWRRESCGLNFR